MALPTFLGVARAHSERRHASRAQKKDADRNKSTVGSANALATGTFLGLGFPSCGTFLGVCAMDTKEGPMSFYSSCRGLPQRFRLMLSSFTQRDDLAFASVLPEAAIEQAFVDADADFAPFEDDITTRLYPDALGVMPCPAGAVPRQQLGSRAGPPPSRASWCCWCRWANLPAPITLAPIAELGPSCQ